MTSLLIDASSQPLLNALPHFLQHFIGWSFNVLKNGLFHLFNCGCFFRGSSWLLVNPRAVPSQEAVIIRHIWRAWGLEAQPNRERTWPGSIKRATYIDRCSRRSLWRHCERLEARHEYFLDAPRVLIFFATHKHLQALLLCPIEA